MSSDTIARGMTRAAPRVLDEGEIAPGVPRSATAPTDLAPAAATSLLATLRERVEEAEATNPLHLDLQVPRMRGVWVRYRPTTSQEINALTKRIGDNVKVEDDRKPLVTNAAILCAACLGVYVVDDAGEPVGDPDTWVRPGAQLARELGRDPSELPTAADTLLALYRTDGDLMSASVQVNAWSAEDSTVRKAPDPGE